MTATDLAREPAATIDIDACKRAALRELRASYQSIVHGPGGRFAHRESLRMRRTVYRLALAMGNQSYAEEYLGEQPLLCVTHDDAAKADAAELDRAVERDNPHEGTLADLHKIEERIATIDAELVADPQYGYAHHQ